MLRERAAGRILNERDGRADAAFLRGVLKAEYLPTAVGNASDHYVLLTPGGEPRFLTVEEVARGIQIPSESPLMRMLSSPTPLTVIQAVSCLGQSIHVGVGRSLVSKLLGDGSPDLRAELRFRVFGNRHVRRRCGRRDVRQVGLRVR